MRSDLFRRPLESALITDFFGGVSQAEVFPITEESTNIFSQTVESCEDELSTAHSESLDTGPYSPALNATTLGNDNPMWDVRWKDLRKWTSIAIVGSLCSWVFLVR